MDKIIYFGHHKCGSRFFRQEVLAPIAKLNNYAAHQYKIETPIFHFETAHDIDLYNVDFELLKSGQKIIISLINSGTPVVEKAKQQTPNFRGLHVVRDPRQILVSAYFHHRDGHNITTSLWAWDKLLVDRPRLLELDREAGLLYELDNITKDILDNQISTWTEDARILEMKLEDFEADPPGELRRIGDFLGLDYLPEVRVNGTTKHQNPTSLHWQDVFTPKIKAVFKERYGELLIRLGYESGINW